MEISLKVLIHSFGAKVSIDLEWILIFISYLVVCSAITVILEHFENGKN